MSMKIEWNKVTWYSKLIAVIVFVATFFVGFYLGKETTKINNIDKASELPINIVKSEDISKDGKYCFSRFHVATASEPYEVQENISLDIIGDLVVGIKEGTQKGPDMTNGYSGSLNGNIKENIMELIYSYTIEGSNGKELEIYEIRDDSLIKKRWTLTEKDKMLVPIRIGEPQIIPYIKEECK